MLSAERIGDGPADISKNHEECAIVGLAQKWSGWSPPQLPSLLRLLRRLRERDEGSNQFAQRHVLL